MQSLESMAPQQRPREKLLRDGAHALEPAELLALVLGTGRGSGEDALQLSARILESLGGVEGVAGSSPEVLQGLRGVGTVRSARIRAAFELGMRANGQEPAPEHVVPADPLAEHVDRLRGQVAAGERAVLGYRPGSSEAPLTLALGETLGEKTPIGAFLARLVDSGVGPWWLVAVRPRGAVEAREKDAAARLLQAAGLVGLDLARVLVLAGRRRWLLDAEAPR